MGMGKSWWSFLRRDLNERQIAQLSCDGIPTDHVSRIGEVLGGFEFAFSVTAFA